MTRRKRRIRNEVCLRDLRKGVFKNRISAERARRSVFESTPKVQYLRQRMSFLKSSVQNSV